ncbi:Adaptin N terminal region family protein [Histomonas meleagridis]|uniref:Adaptin N terminal region family protein n=1 Tax=Histomonas meleagridis TaxID=135588 RepID=UPI00355AA3DD|nr:Adaptin N terminal region family protein [Histomonas meleagridis]KAH0805267.1 Adaptin N terminal region family protein [Histomonas meleagridis]
MATLREQLEGNDPYQRKKAAKIVISKMRGGENVQLLFSSILRCVKTDDLELKKLAYLYLVNYSSKESEQAIMAVNTFIQDSQDNNPLIRALAVRNMCRIRLENVAEHMIQPLSRCLKDEDPYVRKTSVFGVVKLYDIIPESVENSSLFKILLSLLNDENPMVVSNTTAAILEINEKRTNPLFLFNSENIGPILSAATSCTEWCLSLLLDALSKYKPTSVDDASYMIDRLLPFTKQSNPAVVIGAFKCIFLFLGYSNKDPQEVFEQALPPVISFITTGDNEIQFVILRTISLFVLKYPNSLDKSIRLFFVKYNDPSYIKMEKLDIVMSICKPRNAKLVLGELREYCNFVDVSFVRKSIYAIGQIALKQESFASSCVDILNELFQGKADYAIEEAIIVSCDIFRKYPGKFESILASICSCLDIIKEPKAKVAAIWILGEYCHVIDKVDVFLDPFLDSFHDESELVQLQILSSLVKIYLYKPDLARDQLQFAFNEATKDGNIPDVKNRALIYWRMLSIDVNEAKNIILFDKQNVESSQKQFTDDVLLELIKNIGNVSGVLHIVPSDFVTREKYIPEADDFLQIDDISKEEVHHIWKPIQLTNNNFIDLMYDFNENNFYLKMINKSMNNLDGFAIAINKNVIGLSFVSIPTFPAYIESGDIFEISIPYKIDLNDVGNVDKNMLQIALRTNEGTVYGLCKIPIEYTFTNDGNISQDKFRELYVSNKFEFNVVLNDVELASDNDLMKRKVFIVGKNENKTYVSFAMKENEIFVGEIIQNNPQMAALIKAQSSNYLKLVQDGLIDILAKK